MLQCAAHIAEAQSIPVRGAEATLDVATWNIEWFGDSSNGPSDDARQIANVRAVIEQADVDLWGVQEMADPDDFAALLDGLGDGYDGVLAEISGQLRIGFIYKTSVFGDVVIRHILTSFAEGPNNPFAGRPPLQMEADVTLGGATRRLTFIVLHMKCCSDQSSYDRRVEAARRLKNNLDFLRPNDPILILGDFNDELTRSIRAGQPSPYDGFLRDTTRYFFPSLSIEDAGLGTFCFDTACGGSSTIDHLLVTDELAPFYVADSAGRFDALLDAFDGTGGACGGEYVCTTSDHLPVVASFRFDVADATEDAAATEAFVVHPAYPNPFHDRATLRYTLPHAADVLVEVFDLLGRRVATPAVGFRPAGEHRLALDAAGWPTGVYVVRVAARGLVTTQRVVRMR